MPETASVPDLAGEGGTASKWRTWCRPQWCIPVLLALFFAAMALRGAWSTSPVYPDAPRHAMNGVFLLDMLREGGWTEPIRFARSYYAHLPALSLPYHPPVFPLFEAGLFAIFGVSTATARMAVALTVGASCVLLFALARGAGASVAAASAGVTLFFATRVAQEAGADVMLEFPAMVPTAAALLLLQRSLGRGPEYRGLLPAAFLTAIAIFTKQPSVFVAAVPVMVVLLRRDLRMLRAWRFWAFHAITVGAFAAVLMLGRLAGPVTNSTWKSYPLPQMMMHHAQYYFESAQSTLTLPGLVVCVAALAIVLWLRFRALSFSGLDVLAASIVASFGLLLGIPPWDGRYLFHTYALLALAIGIVLDMGMRRVGVGTAARSAAFGVAAAVVFFAWYTPAPRLRGFGEAARSAARLAPGRIFLLSLGGNGAFTFEFRAAQSERKTHVLRAHSLPDEDYRADRFLAVLHDYGVNLVVAQDTPGIDKWESIFGIEDPRLQLLSSTPVTGGAWGGELKVFRFTDPSPQPRNTMTVATDIGGRERTIVLDADACGR